MRTPLTLALIGLALATIGTGCDDGDDTVPPSTRDALATPRAFTVAAAESTASLHAELVRGPTTETADVTLAVTAGAFTAGGAGPMLELDGLTIDIGDVALPVTVFPAQLTLTGVHVHLAAPLSLVATWDDDDERATLSGRGALRLEWSLRIDDAVYPLGSQTIVDLGFALAASRDEGDLRVDVNVAARGVMWTWADIIALGDLDLHVTGRAAMP